MERKHDVFQDRFVKELRLKDIRTIEDANTLLGSGYVDKLNQKFGKEPCNPKTAHRVLDGIDLNQIFCWEFERTVSNDWCVSFKGKYYQIEKQYGDLVRSKSNVCVRKYLNGALRFWHGEKTIVVKELLVRPEKSEGITAKSGKNILSHSQVGQLAKQNSP